MLALYCLLSSCTIFAQYIFITIAVNPVPRIHSVFYLMWQWRWNYLIYIKWISSISKRFPSFSCKHTYEQKVWFSKCRVLCLSWMNYTSSFVYILVCFSILFHLMLQSNMAKDYYNDKLKCFLLKYCFVVRNWMSISNFFNLAGSEPYFLHMCVSARKRWESFGNGTYLFAIIWIICRQTRL